jgi:hypothetical protein
MQAEQNPFARARIHDGEKKSRARHLIASSSQAGANVKIGVRNDRRPSQYRSRARVSEPSTAMGDMFTMRAGRVPQLQRVIVAALLLFSCARVIRPLASWTAGTSPEVAVRCLQVTRNVVLEVGAGAPKLVRPSVLWFREVLVAPAPTLAAFQANQTLLFVRIWPELRRSLLHRILPSASDAGH